MARSAPQYVKGEAIVTFKKTSSLKSARAALDTHALTLTKYFGFLSRQRRQTIGLVRRKDLTTPELMAELKKDPSVATAEPNYLRWPTTRRPNDALFPQLWAMNNTGQMVRQTLGAKGDDIKFLGAWSLARPSDSNVVVAVIDTGADYLHPDLAANIWVNPGENPTNGLDDDHNGYVDDYHGWDFADNSPDISDSGDHGTHVAGTIAAVGNNEIGVIGVDYRAKIMVLKASNDGSDFTDAAIIQAIQYATMMKQRGINVVAINASFGGAGYDSAMDAAIQSAGDAGIVFCAAAGNNGTNNDISPTYPASYRLPNMIVVAASDQNDQLASFSDYGPTTVDLAAPGMNILSTLPTYLCTNVTTYVQHGFSTYAANPLTYAGYTTGVSGTVYDCGLGYPTNFPAAVKGNIALISRGGIYFSAKVANATAAGAKAVIIYNNLTGNFIGTLQTESGWIPAVSVSQADGLAVKASLPATLTVVHALAPNKSYQYLDGTSMATPHVTGAVAFAAMNFPDETVTQRVQRILANVDVVPGLQGWVVTGGVLDLQRTVDTDGNGLPDWWEQMYFGHLTGTNPNADPDHDGASNLAEWLAGTNPTNATSYLHLNAPSLNPATGVVILSWPSAPDRFYRLERGTNLLTGFNTLVATNIAATPPLNVETDNAVGPEAAHFYRIQVEPEEF